MRDMFGPVAAANTQVGGRYAIVLATDEAKPLDATLRRAMRFADRASHVFVSTTRGEGPGGAERVARWPGVRWVEQPRDLDTTPGLLLPLLQVLASDPWAWVAVLPGDGAEGDDEEVPVGRGSSIAGRLRRHAPDWWSALTNSFFRPADLDAVYARMRPSRFDPSAGRDEAAGPQLVPRHLREPRRELGGRNVQ
jgi:hypothetical protein